MNLYSDSICYKSVQLLNTNRASGQQDQSKEQLSPGDGSFHGVCSDMEEFSELLSRVSTSVLWFQLMTQPQRVQTRSLWREENPKPAIAPAVPEELLQLRPYMEQLIKEDHIKQWKRAARQGKLKHLD